VRRRRRRRGSVRRWEKTKMIKRSDLKAISMKKRNQTFHSLLKDISLSLNSYFFHVILLRIPSSLSHSESSQWYTATSTGS